LDYYYNNNNNNNNNNNIIDSQNKPFNPYIRRHSALTEKSTKLKSSTLNHRINFAQEHLKNPHHNGYDAKIKDRLNY
jgi:hypothetical protein